MCVQELALRCLQESICTDTQTQIIWFKFCRHVLLLTLKTTYWTSVSSLEWQPYLCGPTCGMSDAPLSPFLLTDRVIICMYVCVWVPVCVHHCFVSVWFQGWGRLQEWPLCCLIGRHDPSRSASITTWNLNVKHAPLPLLQPFVFLCGSVCLDTRLCTQTHSPVIIWAQIYAAGCSIQGVT